MTTKRRAVRQKKEKELTTEQKIKLINDNFTLWCKNFVFITNNEGQLIPFELHKQQQYFADNMEKFNIILKARQLGFTTVSLAYCLWMALTKPNTNYLIVSYKGESSSSLFEKIKIMNDNLPRDKFNFPKVRRDNRSELLFSTGSRIQCVVAGTKEIARGNSYNYILLSEFAFFEEQEKALLSIEQALSRSTDAKLVIETTANGYDFFQELWSSATKGQSKYKPFFYSWYESAYKDLFKVDYDEAAAWYKSTDKGRLLKSEYLEPDELKLWKAGATLRQLTWRRWKLLDMSEEDFRQEYPATDLEAFISTGQSVFDQNKILQALENAMPEIPYAEYKAVLPRELERYTRGLHIFHLPKPGMKYNLGADTASGGGGNTDNSAVCIFDSDGVQVCTWADNTVPVHKFAELINSLGRWYNFAFACCESNSFGLPLLERLDTEYNYYQLYRSRIFDQRGRKRSKLGWNTTNITKAILIADMKESFEEGLVLLNCQQTLEEMRIYVENDGKMGNKKGANLRDDLVIATALAIQAAKSGIRYA